MSKVKIFIFFLGCVVFIVSCTYKKGVIPSSAKVKVPDSCFTNISYSKQIVPIVTTYCGVSGNLGSCHQSGKSGNGFDFSSYASMSSYFTLMKTRINLLDNDPSKMPQSLSKGPLKLTDCDLSKLNAWLDNGHLNN